MNRLLGRNLNLTTIRIVVKKKNSHCLHVAYHLEQMNTCHCNVRDAGNVFSLRDEVLRGVIPDEGFGKRLLQLVASELRLCQVFALNPPGLCTGDTRCRVTFE